MLHSLWLHTPSPAPNPFNVVSLGTTDSSGRRTPPMHPSGTLLTGLRVSAPSMDPSGESLSTSNQVSSARVDQAAFSSESGVPAPKGVTAPTGWPQETVGCSVQS